MIKLSDKAKKLIDGKNFANVAAVTPDGWPHVTPIWVDRDGDYIILNITKSRAKYKYFEKNPKIAISIFDMSNPYYNVVIRGKVAEAITKGAEDHIDKMAKKYFGQEKYPAHQADDPRVMLRVEPLKETGMG
ncbi:MAG: PPOX class F420-dependent oxidoreductase [Nitrososphaerales archaeon]